ncbi:hypothetical protein EMCRGX_G032459 [Ephydatia muelleri]|eukprot:Em0019g238a
MAVVPLSTEDAQRYQCSYCGCDITLRLKCASCNDFDLCLHCFSSGATAGSHKPDHPYQLIDEGSFPLLTMDWGAIEEVLLLDAVEQDGLGNWDDIAAHVVTKTAKESKEHYNDLYVNGIIGEGTIPPTNHESALNNQGGEAPPSPPHYTPVCLEHPEQMELGYMPYRDDFEREYDNNAEAVISEMSFTADDDDIEKALKLAHVDMYNRRMAERERRKGMAHQHNLIVGKQKLSTIKKKMSKEEKELGGRYHQFARLMEPEKYEEFIQSLKKEKLLKHRIKELMRYRRNGITKLDECSEFELLRPQQDKAAEKQDMDTARSFSATDSEQDRSLAPGFSLLSLAERKLCNTVAMKPNSYLHIKAEVLKSSALRRLGYSVQPKLPTILASEHRQKLGRFMTTCGWLC